MKATQRWWLSFPFLLAIISIIFWGWGIWLSFVSPYDGIISDAGVVTEIFHNGPSVHDIRVGDLILSVEDVPSESFVSVYQNKRAGDKVQLTIQRNKEVIEVLEDLEKDMSVPKNVKDQIKTTIDALKEEKDVKISVNKALHELDEIADDPNLQPYTRTQIWNIVSLLEKIS